MPGKFEERARFIHMHAALRELLNDLTILAGEKVGPSDASWQDVASAAAIHAANLARQLHAASQGNHEAMIVFPSPAECLETETQR